MISNMDNRPKLNKPSFICPHCSVVAQQEWTDLTAVSDKMNRALEYLYLEYRSQTESYIQYELEKFRDFARERIPGIMPILFVSRDLKFANCQNCSNVTVWLKESMIYPRWNAFPDPNEDMAPEIQGLYLEAAKIFQDSPRASAALLRLGVEKLCAQLGVEGNLNASIGNLVKQGLNLRIQQALDYCRVIGNNAVHAGRIMLEEDSDRVAILFELINDIADEMLTKPKIMAEKYSSLPEETRLQIETRDTD